MQGCVIQSCVALLGLVMAVGSHSALAQPDLEGRHHRILQRTRSAGERGQDWDQQAVVEDLLSQLSLPEGEVQKGQGSAGRGESDDLRVALERSAENPKELPPRERKAGCKNFYWKGFTSC